jgi:hypothetical protein
MDTLTLIMGIAIVTFLGLLLLTILVSLWIREAKGTGFLWFLISEPYGKASLSRFQNLVFTFVIALSFTWVVLSTSKFPEVPAGVFGLLGISGGTYLISKGVSATHETTTQAEKMADAYKVQK